VKDICKQQTLTEPKLEQVDKLLYKTFIAMVLKENPWLDIIIEEAESFYDEMKINDNAHFLKVVTKITYKNLSQYGYCLITQNLSGPVGARLLEFCLPCISC